ncbi:Glu/Leu/Phe/Val dehydrogenase dimerization domain-containing protein [Streptomyces roseifaciens]
MSATSCPEKIIEWEDERTGAPGWIVIDRLVNGVSGGGLFMHPGATLEEVSDLAATMSLKNTLLDPVIGGGKGGIKFDPDSPEALGVLRRFMQAHRDVIENEWSTGADLYTSGEAIESIARDDLGLPSAFVAMAHVFAQNQGIPSQAGRMSERIQTRWNDYFTVAQAATGHSVAESVRLVAPDHPKVAIQGFGSVGSSLAHCLTTWDIGTVVAICENDGFLHDAHGVDTYQLIRRQKRSGQSLGEYAQGDTHLKSKWTPRGIRQSDEEFLVEFIHAVRPDVFSPCALRYAVTRNVMEAFVECGAKFIVCGANNAFCPTGLPQEYQGRGIGTLPEWVSNCGGAILFSEVLKTRRWDRREINRIFGQITDRITALLEADPGLITGGPR